MPRTIQHGIELVNEQAVVTSPPQARTVAQSALLHQKMLHQVSGELHTVAGAVVFGIGSLLLLVRDYLVGCLVDWIWELEEPRERRYYLGPLAH